LRVVSSSTAVSSDAEPKPGWKELGEGAGWMTVGAGAGAGWVACCASAGSANAAAAPATKKTLVRITLRDIHFDGARRLFLRKSRQEIEPAEDEQDDDQEDCSSWHGGAFAERESRCIALSTYGFGEAS
jgi:hypothetical protein